MFKFVYFIVLNYALYQEFRSPLFMARAAEIMTKINNLHAGQLMAF